MGTAVDLVAALLCAACLSIFMATRRERQKSEDILLDVPESLSAYNNSVNLLLVGLQDFKGQVIEALKEGLKEDVRVLISKLDNLKPRDKDEELYRSAIGLLQARGHVSGHMLRVNFHVGHGRATKIIQRLVDAEVVELDTTAGVYRPSR